MNDGTLLIFSAPSGAGKTTLAKMFMEKYPNIQDSVSYTTRAIRGVEVDGRDYFFVGQDKFNEMISSGDFLEYATIHGNLYGTSFKFIETSIKSGKDVLLVIDPQGVSQITDRFSGKTIKIFIVAKIDELRRRLISRAEESIDEINKRLENGKKEVCFACDYDYLVVNDKLEDAFNKIEAVYLAEKLKIKYMNDEDIYKYVGE